MIRKILCASFLLFFGGLLFSHDAYAAKFCNGTQEPKAETQCYDEDGFFSSFRIIEQGTKIIFINDSKENLEVASGPHPSHEALPDLDSTVITPGSSWSYTFTKRGKWSYHNHFQEDHEAEVLVVKKKVDGIFTAKVPDLQVGAMSKKAAGEKMPKLPQLSKKKGMKPIISVGKAEVTLRVRRLEGAISMLRDSASQSSIDQKTLFENQLQSAQQDLNRVREIGKKIDQARDKSTVEIALKELLSLRILSERLGSLELQRNTATMRSILETYEDLALQLEPALQWQESDEGKEELSDKLSDVKDTITRLDDELDDLSGTPQSSIRSVYERITKDIKGVGKVLRSVITGVKNLNTNQNTSKGMDDLTSGRACENSRASSYQSLDVICYKDEPIDFWNYSKVGKKIYFYNASSHDLWLASDPHPSHTSYPEFNSGKVILPGSYFEFIFTKAGKYTYHNHLKPEQTMKLKIGATDTIEIEAEDMAKMQPKFGMPLNK